MATVSTTQRPSVVVRAKNEEAKIIDALRSLREQSVEVEIVLVDSGSTDRTVELARPYCDVVVTMPPESFTYGRALNIGAARSTGEVIFALSAHCSAPDKHWASRHLAHYDDPRVAGVFGFHHDPLGVPLTSARPVTWGDVQRDPYWGFTNHASSWRRSVWEQLPFNEAMPACEDKEWMWRALLASYIVVADPAVDVSGAHRRQEGLVALWKREVLVHQALARALDYPPATASQVLTTWWSSFPWPSRWPRWLRRLSPYRAVEIFGGYVGEHAGAAQRDKSTLHFLPTSTTARP